MILPPNDFTSNNNDPFNSTNFSYFYSYTQKLILSTDDNFLTTFTNYILDNIANPPKGKLSDYYACYKNTEVAGAKVVSTSYVFKGKAVSAAVQVLFKIKGENRNDDIFKEVDNIVLSSKK